MHVCFWFYSVIRIVALFVFVGACSLISQKYVMICAITLYCIWLITTIYVFGRYGNLFYYKTVISKIRHGYCLSKNFVPTSPLLALSSWTFIPSSLCMLTSAFFDYLQNSLKSKNFEISSENIGLYLCKTKTVIGYKKLLIFIEYLLIIICNIVTLTGSGALIYMCAGGTALDELRIPIAAAYLLMMRSVESVGRDILYFIRGL